MSHRHARGANVGLTVALGLYWDRYNSARRKNGGKACEGEELCRLNGPLRDKSRPVEAICGGCDLLPTKPGTIPNHLAHLIITAHRMEALFESHAGASYPVEFAPLEWEAFLTLKYARAKDDEARMPKTDKKPAQSSEEQRLRMRLAQG